MDVYNLKDGLGYYYANHDTDTRLSVLYFEQQSGFGRWRF